MKTPQQIKNEVEKKGLEIMERLRNDVKEGKNFIVKGKDYPSYLNVIDNEVNMAKLLILTEYDKAMMIELDKVINDGSWKDLLRFREELKLGVLND